MPPWKASSAGAPLHGAAAAAGAAVPAATSAAHHAIPSLRTSIQRYGTPRASGGGPRERLERHLEASRHHQRIFDQSVARLRGSRGASELFAGVLRSGFAAVGSIGATAAQVATLPLAVVRRGGGEERLLENAGVEGAALANKLVILTALRRALTEAGEDSALADVETVRADALDAWEALLEQTPELMSALVGARSHEPSFDFRTAGAVERVHERG